MSGGFRAAMKDVKPIKSLTSKEAHSRVLSLYRAWVRELPYTIQNYHLPVTVQEAKIVLRREFRKHKTVSDLRVLDLIIFKGQQELVETANIWKSPHHVMKYFEESDTTKPTDFMGKFLDGYEP